MLPEQKVQIFSIGTPKKGTPSQLRRYKTKWAVDGRHRTRSFKTKEQAERLRSKLLEAVRYGFAFDPNTGEPERWSQAVVTWWGWSSQWFDLKWPHLAGTSRRSLAEGLILATPLLARHGAPDPPITLPSWLRRNGYVTTVTNTDGPELAWLSRWSVPLNDVTPGLLETMLSAITTRQDGQPTSAQVSKRRQSNIKSAFRAAKVRGLIDENPFDRVMWSLPRDSTTIQIDTLPSVSEVLKIVESIANDISNRHYAAFFATLVYSGMRPSEAARLRVDDLELPRSGWGMAQLSGALPSPGHLYSSTGSATEEKSLKHRPEGTIRPVPLPSTLVSQLRWHVAEFEKSASDRVFTNLLGNDLTKDNWGRPWRIHRRQFWTDGRRFASTRPYDLRHVAATMMLRAGVPAAEVALRLGHSIDMLMKIYAGVFEDERERANKMIEIELRQES